MRARKVTTMRPCCLPICGATPLSRSRYRPTPSAMGDLPNPQDACRSGNSTRTSQLSVGLLSIYLRGRGFLTRCDTDEEKVGALRLCGAVGSETGKSQHPHAVHVTP